MSLYVSLYSTAEETCTCFHCGSEYKEQKLLYDANITHNLGGMAEKAGIYEALWRPYRLKENYNKEIEQLDSNDEQAFESSTIVQAKEIVDIVRKGLTDLKARPEYYEQFNSSNGWGLYENFVPFVEDYLTALEENPDAIVSVSR